MGELSQDRGTPGFAGTARTAASQASELLNGHTGLYHFRLVDWDNGPQQPADIPEKPRQPTSGVAALVPACGSLIVQTGNISTRLPL